MLSAISSERANEEYATAYFILCLQRSETRLRRDCLLWARHSIYFLKEKLYSVDGREKASAKKKRW